MKPVPAESDSRSRALRANSYPLLPDCLGEDVDPAPDGHPWLKACDRCAFRPSTDEHACTGMNRGVAVEAETVGPFYCLHRDDDGRHRVCAGWAACQDGGTRKRKIVDRVVPHPTMESDG